MNWCTPTQMIMIGLLTMIGLLIAGCDAASTAETSNEGTVKKTETTKSTESMVNCTFFVPEMSDRLKIL